MPASATDNLRLLRAHSDLCARPSRSPASPRSPTSPRSPGSPVLPPSLPPFTTLRRSFSSTFTLIPEERSASPERPPAPPLLLRAITWYPRTLLAVARAVLAFVFHPAWRQMLVVLPTLWISAWLWIFWKCIRCPLSALEWCLTSIYAPSADRTRHRTVLVGCGSTVQTLHLARNFYSAGARVVAFEVEGQFGLVKFSTAVDKFYTVPRPSASNPHAYVRALVEIAQRERAAFYVPVGATVPAYYDALAKPHLELLGCVCFVPGLRDVTLLDDTLEVLQRCQGMGLPTPNYATVTSEADVATWYSSAPPGRHFMAGAGAAGARDRVKFLLPASHRDFRAPRLLGPERPWVIVHDVRGERFLTCTTVKESRVIANVTCRIDSATRGLMAREDRDIEAWIQQFFERLETEKPVTGHISFRFVRDSATGLVLPLGVRVGVSLPYICHTSVHPRLLVRPCRHFDRRNSGPLVASTERYWMHEAVLSTLRHPGVEAVGKLIGTVLDKREALFAYWDPLPYCAYYHFQLPYDSMRGMVRRGNDGGAEEKDASTLADAELPAARRPNGVHKPRPATP